jgi:ABC-type phosphate/phosphonate transport system substrate-binding protein
MIDRRQSRSAKLSVLLLFVGMGAPVAIAQTLTCWFAPDSDSAECKIITDALMKEAHVAIRPRVSYTYTEVIQAFSSGRPQLAYIGSFVSAILQARGLGAPLVQKVDGRELYAGIMIYPKGKDPATVLDTQGEQIAYSVGSSAGESSAKAATGGKASIRARSNLAAAIAVVTGKAKAAFVKSTWWTDNHEDFPDLESFEVPGISEPKNPDNILWVSQTVPTSMRENLIRAAKKAKDAFGAQDMKDFDPHSLAFSLDLMKRSGIDAQTYSW